MQESQIGKATTDLTDHSMSGTAHTYYMHAYVHTQTCVTMQVSTQVLIW